jgi:hypothetical protein
VVFSRCAEWRALSAPVVGGRKRGGEAKTAARGSIKLREIARKAGLRGRKLQFFDMGKSEQFRPGMRGLLRPSPAKINGIALKVAFAARHQNSQNLD